MCDSYLKKKKNKDEEERNLVARTEGPSEMLTQAKISTWSLVLHELRSKVQVCVGEKKLFLSWRLK